MARSEKPAIPRSVSLDGTRYSLRHMTSDDGDRLLAFARSLPQEDLLFLRIDITKQEAVDEWIAALEEGQRVTVLAERGKELVAYGSLNRRTVDWQRHLGEIRVIVAPEARSSGLGSLLAEEMFTTARGMGLTKIVAQMAREQDGARRMFQRLGFTAEALLADWIQDRSGKPHDLVLMSYDVTSLT